MYAVQPRLQTSLLCTALLFTLGITLLGCATASNGGGGSDPPPVISVSISPSSASAQTGQTVSFSAVVTNAANTNVVWKVNGVTGGDATHGTISGSGVFTAPASVPNPAVVTVAAFSQADSTKSASAQVTITSITSPISVTVSPASSTLNVGKSLQLSATVSNDSQNKGVTWSVSGTGCSGSSCGTVSNGLYTAPATAPSSPVSVTATSVADPTRSGAATVTVLPAVSVSLTPIAPTIQVGQTQSFTATAQNDPGNQGVSWSLTQAGISCSPVCGTLSAATNTSVTFTAPAAVPADPSVTLTASSLRDSGQSASTVITVSNHPTILVTITPVSVAVQAGMGSQTFNAAVQNDTQNQGVTWSLSGTGCSGATCGTLTNVTTTGATYTAPATAPSPNTVTLKATSVADSTKSSSATITITAPVAVSVSPVSASVNVTKTQQFTATVSNDSQNKGVVWQVNGVTGGDATHGTISTGGLYTAPASLPSPASVTISAVSVADPTRNATATVTVLPAISVSVAPSASSCAS